MAIRAVAGTGNTRERDDRAKNPRHVGQPARAWGSAGGDRTNPSKRRLLRTEGRAEILTAVRLRARTGRSATRVPHCTDLKTATKANGSVLRRCPLDGAGLVALSRQVGSRRVRGSSTLPAGTPASTVWERLCPLSGTVGKVPAVALRGCTRTRCLRPGGRSGRPLRCTARVMSGVQFSPGPYNGNRPHIVLARRPHCIYVAGRRA